MLSFQFDLLGFLLKLLHTLKIPLFLQLQLKLFFFDFNFYLLYNFNFLLFCPDSQLLHLVYLSLSQCLSLTVKLLLLKNLFFFKFLLSSKRFIILLFYKFWITFHFLFMFECLFDKLLFLIIEVFTEPYLR